MNDQAIINAYQRGDTITQIIRDLNTHKKGVYKVLNDNGIKKRYDRPYWPAQGHWRGIDKQGYIKVNSDYPKTEHRLEPEEM
jgi:hypothetical protein